MTPKELRKLQDAVKAERCRRSMPMFFKEVVWPQVEGGTGYLHNWHIDAICDHLQAVVDGQIRDLLINVPPRFAKSLLSSVLLNAYVWATSPEKCFIYSSYNGALTLRDAVRCRRVIEGDFYQKNYCEPDGWALADDQNQKIYFETTKNGSRLSTSVNGQMTGQGADIIVTDDPHNVRQAESDGEREGVVTWYDETLSSRYKDPKTLAKILVMQRLNEGDLSGHVIEQGTYEKLILPMRFDPERRCVTVLGFQDPRTEEGELLWKDRFDEGTLEKIESAMGVYAVAGQHQQTPAPRGGNLIIADRIKVVDILPAGMTWWRSWDLAATEEKIGNDPAWTVGVLIGKDKDNRIYIGDVKRERLSSNGVKTLIKATAIEDGVGVKVRIPQDPGQAGKAQVEDFTALLIGWIVKALPESGSKTQRAEPFASAVEGGIVHMLRAPWNVAYRTELSKFPAGKFKDQVDATSNGFNELIPPATGAAVYLRYLADKKLRDQQVKDRITGAANVRQLTGTFQ